MNQANVKVAAFQMTVGPEVDANFRRIAGAMERAAGAGARLLALPECALSGYPPLHYPNAQDIDTARIAELNDEVAQLAAQHRIWVVLGTLLMSSEGLLNSALVISDEGEVAGRYDKLHLMSGDRRFFTPGRQLPIFDLGGMPFGVLICYDTRFPEPFRCLREQGARAMVVILNACGGDTWKIPVLEGTFRARAAENTCFVIAANAAGPLQMCTSRIVDPRGLDLASTNQDREEMIFADIDLSLTVGGHFQDRRTDMFQVIGDYLDETV